MELLRDYQRWPRATRFARVALAVASGRTTSDLKQFDGAEIAHLAEVANDRITAEKRVYKTASPLTLDTGAWADWAESASEFVQLVYDAALVGRLPAAHRIPFRTAILAPGGDASAAWTGEAGEKPVTEMVLDRVVLDPRKITAVAALAKEVIEGSSVDAARMVLDALVRANVLALDETLITANAAVAGVAPAGILANAQAVASTGTTVAQVAHDLSAMVAIPAAARIAL